MVKHLYIIGNGFDRYHGAKSSYWDFRGYLLRRNDWIAKMFELYFGPRALYNNFADEIEMLKCMQFGKNLPYPKNTWASKYLWNDFERNLSELDREKIFDMVDERIPIVDEDDDTFSYADFFAPIEEIIDIVNACSFEMQYHFHRWVNTLHYEKGFKKRLLQIDPNASFLSFNYTLFLEEHYNVLHENICYIHGHRKQPFGSLILGHGKTDPDKAFDEWRHKHRKRRRYRDNLKDKRGRYFANDKLVYLAYFLKDEVKGNYRLPIRYYAIDMINQNLDDYYNRNMKRCDDIIRNNSKYFSSLHDVETITVLGHSLSVVDMPYYEEIIRNVKNPSHILWQFSYHTTKDIDNINRFCRHFGIHNWKNVRL